jgi:predicted transcriptional regulator
MNRLPHNPEERQAVLEAIRRFDLPTFLQQHYGPDTVVQRSSRRCKVRCRWRGDDRNPSGSLSYGKDGWVWFDFAMNEGGGTLELLANKMGLGYEAAWEVVLGRRVDLYQPKRWNPPQPTKPKGQLAEPTKAGLERLAKAQDRMNDGVAPRRMLGRGLSFEDMLFYGIGKGENGGDVYLPILGPSGKVTAVKIRLDVEKGAKTSRFRYLEEGYIHKVYHAPGYHCATRGIILVEGEMKAVSVHNAGRYYEPLMEYGVMGMPGTNAYLDADAIAATGLPVYIFIDPDAAGHKAAREWQAQLGSKGVEVILVEPKGDLCDIAQWFVDRATASGEEESHRVGNERFGRWLLELMFRSREKLPLQKVYAKLAGHINPRAFEGVGGHHAMRLAQQMMRNVASGRFMGVTSHNEAVLSMSATDAASILGSGDRKQGRATLNRLVEMGFIRKAKDEEIAHLISNFGHTPPSKNAVKENKYIINSSFTNYFFDGGGAAANADENWISYDGVMTTERLVPITARGQLVLQRLRKVGGMTQEDIEDFLGVGATTAWRIIRRLTTLGLATYQDKVLRYNTDGQYKRVLDHIKAFCKDRKEQMWRYIKLKATQWFKQWRQARGFVTTNNGCLTRQLPSLAPNPPTQVATVGF